MDELSRLKEKLPQLQNQLDSMQFKVAQAKERMTQASGPTLEVTEDKAAPEQ